MSGGSPEASSPAVRDRMQGQRRTGTEPELRIRRALWRRGRRYRVNFRIPGERGSIDVVFTRQRVAVFVDGCFWHSCPIHGTIPKSNREWWLAKLSANRARDLRFDEVLRQSGWRVIRVWEHEDPDEAVAMIEVALGP